MNAIKAASIFLACLPPSLAAAQSSSLEAQAKRLQLADSLGHIFAAEHPCGYSYDQSAIAAWLTAHVPARDITFAQSLNLMTQAAEMDLKRMTTSEKTAQCALAGASARRLGFMK